jgi:hypothetical protein
MKTLCKFILLCAVVGAATAVSGQDSKPPFSLSISMKNAEVKSGENVQLTITKTNISDHEIDVGIEVGSPERSYDIDVVDSAGKTAAETSYGRKVHGKERLTQSLLSTTVVGKLAPGKAMEEDLYVNRVFDFTRPGRYSIRVTQTDPVSKVRISSNKVTLVVIP